jgi:hypothetical protein
MELEPLLPSSILESILDIVLLLRDTPVPGLILTTTLLDPLTFTVTDLTVPEPFLEGRTALESLQEPVGSLAGVLTTKDQDPNLDLTPARSSCSPQIPNQMLSPTHGEVVAVKPGTTNKSLPGGKLESSLSSLLETQDHLADPGTLPEINPT